LQLTILRDDPRLRLTLRPGMNIAWLAFNTAKPPLDNPEVRHALALAINNQRLMQSIYYGTAETAASMLPELVGTHNFSVRLLRPSACRRRRASAGLYSVILASLS
jgi:cationic peptide transport system substrate-binding protein